MKVPIFIAKDTKLPKVGKIFQQGYSHMAVVCEEKESVFVIQKFCEKLHRQIKNCNQQTIWSAEDLKGIGEVVIIGVITYEDVIERTLRVNINDEKDRAHAVQALWLRSGEKHNVRVSEATYASEQIVPHLPTSNCETFPISSFENILGDQAPLTDGVYTTKLLERYVSQEAEEDPSNPPYRRMNTGYLELSDSSKALQSKTV